MPTPGFRVKNSFFRSDPALVKQLAAIPVANIGDTMNRMSCMNARVRPMNDTPLAGCAMTVKVRAGDNLLFHKAIDMALPGDVLVIDAQNEQSYAIFGELMVQWLRKRGITGVVADGCIRDYDALGKMDDIAIYATGITPNGPLKEGGGEINYPVMCGGLVVIPGDIIIGDKDGVVVISPEDAPSVLQKALAHNAKEEQVMKDIANGIWDRTWVDVALKAKGCEFID